MKQHRLKRISLLPGLALLIGLTFVSRVIPSMIDKSALKIISFGQAKFHLPGDDSRAKIAYLENSRGQAIAHDSLEIGASLARVGGA